MPPMAAPNVFRLPDLGEGLTEAVLVQWLVAEGDAIAVDEPIAEVETAKSVVELPSPFDGVVSALHSEPGETLFVGAPLIEVASADASAPADDAAVAEAGAEVYREEERAGSGNVLIGYGTSGADGATGRRRERRQAAARGGAAPADEAKARPVAAHAPAPEPAREAPSDAAQPRVRVRSPKLRQVARELGVDLRAVVPSGTDGVIVRADLLAAAEATRQPAARAAGDDEPTAGSRPPERHRERLSMLRRTVGATLSRSRTEIPEATVWVDVDATDLWNLRPQMARGDERPPSLTAIFARFVLLALDEYPALAGRLSDDGTELILYDGVNLGIAADTERGLMVPSLPRADRLSIRELDTQLRAVAAEARGGGLPPERMRGTTFTLNNYGSFGVDGSAAIINHPEVAILGIGRMIERPWVVDGQIVPRRIVQLSLVFDHRVCDGGYAAGFLTHVATSIERPLAVFPSI